MKFSYNWLQSFFKRKLPIPQKLAEIIHMSVFEVEGIERTGNDFVLDIKVLPNRGSDCFSHAGLAREISAIKNLPLTFEIEKLKITEDKTSKTKDLVSVEVKSKVACPRYNARVVIDVKVGPSPKWLRERLEVCGLRPINNIVDIANYVMLETGQPLHVFDAEKITGKKLVVRYAKKGEKIVTLDEEKYDLDSEVLVIADSEKPLALAGIKGGKGPGIDSKTKTVVLEAANFNPQLIRTTSQKIDLKTDASLRFEYGLDPNLTNIAINRAAGLIQEIAGGKICQGLVDFYPKKVLPQKIKLEVEYVNTLLGVKISTAEIKNILTRLGLKIARTGAGDIDVVVPTRRRDLVLPEDLIEEVGRIFGYEKIPAKFPLASLAPPERNLDIFWENAAKNILKEAGFVEVYNDSFLAEEVVKVFGYNEQDARYIGRRTARYSEQDARYIGRRTARYKTNELVETLNPPSSDFRFLRPSLLPNLLKNIQTNSRNFSRIHIFELGKVFKEGKPMEKLMLSGAILGNSFYEAKGVVDTLFSRLGLTGVWYDEYRATPENSKVSLWHAKKSAEIKAGDQEFGFLGEVSPRILSEMKISQPVVLFDIDFAKLQKFASEEYEYRPISKYPSAVVDIAILVPLEVKVEEVLNVMETAGGEILADTELFDIYEGEQLPQGKKNLAFHLIFQASDRTLSSKEIDDICGKIIKNLEQNPEWEVRK